MTTDEVPDWAKVWLDDDVAQWLHELADRDFDGDVGLALNNTVRAVMWAATEPTRPWALLEARQILKVAAQRRSPGRDPA